MTDLDLTKKCAEAMGYGIKQANELMPRPKRPDGALRVYIGKKAPFWYNPLANDAQAMALVKRFQLWIGGWAGDLVSVSRNGESLSTAKDLNRAIVLCVSGLAT